MSDAPKLLVEWSSPWQEFLTAIRPALRKSPDELAGEARTGLLPYRGMLMTWAAEVLLLIAAIVLPTHLASLRSYAPPPLPKYDVIYFSGDELPQVEDQGGAHSGRSGKAGGHEGHHRTQTIRVSRGDSLRERVVDAPKLNLPRSNAAVANLLAYKPIPGPAPAEGLKSMRAPVALPQTVIAPTPKVAPDKLRAVPSLNSTIIAPPQSSPQREVAALRAPGSHLEQIIPPPVSAPEQTTVLNPKLALPPPSIIAPPPTQVPREMASMGPGLGPDLHKQVIPPPAQLSGSASSRQVIGGLGGSVEVVPPPVQVSGGSLQRTPMGGLGGGTAVVPPPPTVAGDTALSGSGTGRRGAGRGGPLDLGTSVSAPPASGGSGNGTGVVVSSQPGSAVGVPGSGGSGSLALSPSGSGKPGLGGSGGGTGIGRGTGTGSGLTGEGTGAGGTGTGVGADVNARGGTSPYPGAGGAGSGVPGKPAMPGVSVRGGSNIITLPSFGADGNPPSIPGRTSGKGEQGPGLTVVATSRSGGALNFYGLLKGMTYTIYIPTNSGTVVMEYADPASADHSYAGDLQPPQALRADLPANLGSSRLIIACLLDRAGVLKNLQVLESGASDMSVKVIRALANWKFSPVLRRGQPVEVTAILGFNIDTR